MNSNRASLYLTYLSTHHYLRAVDKFKLIADEDKTDKTQQARYQYYHAIARLGALLESLTKDNNVTAKKSAINSLLSNKYSSPAKETLEVDDDKMESASGADAVNKEISSILSLFNLAKDLMKPKQLDGIEHAVKAVIPQLLKLNQSATTHRTKHFAIELAIFELLYTTKLVIDKDLNDDDSSIFSRLFSTNIISILKNAIKAHKDDPLFLSQSNLNELYKQLPNFRNDKQHRSTLARLEKQLFLIDYQATNDDCLEFWRKFKGSITIDKAILVREIYNNHEFLALKAILFELNNNQLLTDKMFTCLKSIVLFDEHYRESIKAIDEALSTSHLENKYELKNDLLEFVLNGVPHPNITDTQFYQFMSPLKNSYTTEKEAIDVNKIYLYLDLLAIFTQNKDKQIPLDKIANLMQQVEKVVGNNNFIALCQKVLQYKISSTEFITIMNSAIQLRTESVGDLFKLIDAHHHDMNTLRHHLNDIIMRDYQLKYPERSLEEVTHDFLTPSADVEYTLDPSEFAELKQRYLRIKAIGEQLLTTGDIGIESALNNYKAALLEDQNDKNAQLTLLAIIRLKIPSLFGINPYNVQMLNVLALLNEPKRIAQIKTGEGKSTLIAILAAYYTLLGHKVDIITTSHDLAIRDVKKYKDFYRSLGIRSGHNISEGNRDNSNCYKNDVVYGTVSDFEFAYLRQETGQSEGRGNRPYDVVIADEVDSMFIDMQRNEAILSQTTEAAHKPEYYRYIWNWINTTEKIKQTRENLQAMFKAKDIDISLDLATTWLKSARTAQQYSENEEYIIGYPTSKHKDKSRKSQQDERVIKIVNKSHTGEVQDESSRWQGGLHQILEAKHNLQIRTESLTSASINHIEFFNKYKILAGVSGTLGAMTCRDELKKLYHVNTYDSPPYKPSCKKQVPHVIAKDEKAQHSAISEIVKDQIKVGRPVLILCESIQDSKDLYEQLSEEIKGVSIYNGVQEDSAEEILGLAGNAGAVTIATNLAGRGTDIVVTPEAEKQGGLHVIVAFPALNRRVEQQAFGRTGRQGKKGTYQYVLNEDQLTLEELEGESIANKIQIMQAEREKHEEHVSMMNYYNYNLMHKLFIIQHIFFSLPTVIKSNSMTKWAQFKTSAHKLTMQYVRNELEDKSENDVFKNVLKDFMDFWKKTIASLDSHFRTPEDFIKSRLKQPFSDDYTKTLLIKGVMFLEKPELDFSSEVADLLVDLKASELEEEKPTVSRESSLMRFYQPQPQTQPESSLRTELKKLTGWLGRLTH